MNYRPYPDIERARHQAQRGRLPEPPSPLLAWIDEAMAPLRLADWQRAWISGWAGLTHPKLTGRSAITAAIADQAVKAGEHVHVAGRDGVRCVGGDDTCGLPRINRGDQVTVDYDGQTASYDVVDVQGHRERPEVAVTGLNLTLRPTGDPACSQPSKGPPRCPGCGHAQHVPGVECEAGVDHGPKRWHRCLCLATPGASRACPPQMDCQGGTLSYADIWHLRHGRGLRGVNGETITPDVLAETQPGAER